MHSWLNRSSIHSSRVPQVRAMRARLCSPQGVWGVPQLCGALPGRMHRGQRPFEMQVCFQLLNRFSMRFPAHRRVHVRRTGSRLGPTRCKRLATDDPCTVSFRSSETGDWAQDSWWSLSVFRAGKGTRVQLLKPPNTVKKPRICCQESWFLSVSPVSKDLGS